MAKGIQTDDSCTNDQSNKLGTTFLDPQIKINLSNTNNALLPRLASYGRKNLILYKQSQSSISKTQRRERQKDLTKSKEF